MSTQATGMPEFDVVIEPGGPHGMPTAGRLSRLPEVVGIVGGVECCLVVGGVEGCLVVGGDALAGGAVVAANDGVDVGGVVVLGAGALTIGGGTAVAGAGRAGGAVVTGAGESTLVGVSSD